MSYTICLSRLKDNQYAKQTLYLMNKEIESKV